MANSIFYKCSWVSEVQYIFKYYTTKTARKSTLSATPRPILHKCSNTSLLLPWSLLEFFAHEPTAAYHFPVCLSQCSMPNQCLHYQYSHLRALVHQPIKIIIAEGLKIYHLWNNNINDIHNDFVWDIPAQLLHLCSDQIHNFRSCS